MVQGWISLHRRFLEWEWYQDINTKSVFIHCLLNANFEAKEWRGIEIKRGDFFTSINHLSIELNLTVKKIRTALKKLIKTKEISIKGTSNGTMITVCKYDDYQDINKPEGKQRASEGQSKGKRRATTNNDNKDNKENNDNKKIDMPTYLEFKNYAIEKKSNIDLESLKLKYESWIENKWQDGNNKPIKNWKSKLLNTIPYLKENGQKRKETKYDINKEIRNNPNRMSFDND